MRTGEIGPVIRVNSNNSNNSSNNNNNNNSKYLYSTTCPKSLWCFTK